MKLEDALFNWLQIRLVADARKDDRAAGETVRFFEQMLQEDHGVGEVAIERKDDTMYYISYVIGGKTKTQLFGREAAEQLLLALETNPKFTQ